MDWPGIEPGPLYLRDCCLHGPHMITTPHNDRHTSRYEELTYIIHTFLNTVFYFERSLELYVSVYVLTVCSAGEYPVCSHSLCS